MRRIDAPCYARPLRLLPAALLALLWAVPAAVSAQDLEPAWQADAAALPHAQRAHLWRVAAWGTANVALGASLLAASSRDDRPARHGFGVQSAAWGAINVGIAAVGLSGGLGDPSASLAAAIRAENAYADVLLLNLGLNVGYAGVGAALVTVGHRAGIESPGTRGALRGHGWALVLQGAGLFVLDGIAWLDGRGRLGRLLDGIETVALAPGIDRIGLVVLF